MYKLPVYHDQLQQIRDTREGQEVSKGLLWILDEEAMFPGASDKSFTDRVVNMYAVKSL